MNKVIVKGRTTKLPEIRYSEDAEPICYARFSLAVEDRTWKLENDKYHVDYISCIARGTLGELVERTVGKGQELLLVGKWNTTVYDRDGQKVYTQTLVIKELYYCGKKADSPAPYEPFMNLPEGIDEELPFK